MLMLTLSASRPLHALTAGEYARLGSASLDNRTKAAKMARFPGIDRRAHAEASLLGGHCHGTILG